MKKIDKTDIVCIIITVLCIVGIFMCVRIGSAYFPKESPKYTILLDDNKIELENIIQI